MWSGSLRVRRLLAPQIRAQPRPGNTRDRLNRYGAVSGNGRDYATLPSRGPFVDRARGYPKLFGQLGTRPSNQDCGLDGVFVHAGANNGTDSSACQAKIVTESSNQVRHARRMDRDGFTRRLTQALDLNGVERTAIERKRFLARLMQVSERHAGNYLSGTKLPTTEGMIDLARKLGVALEWLANGTLPIRPLRLTPEQVGVLERLSPEQIDRLFQIGGILAPADATDPASPLAA